MYLLDTNLLSLLEPLGQSLVPGPVRWPRRKGAHLFLKVISFTELETGILKLRRVAEDTRAAEFETMREAIQRDFGDRILCLDAPVAVTVAHLAEVARSQIIELAELIVAATAKVHGSRS